MPIRVLDEQTALKIAAGEVIERPASVVKELIENAIDAEATAVRVEVRSGGLSFIRISDDGCGIPADEVQTAFQRHATSKVTEADDLYRLTTLGFRGEALPSIAAVSQMTLLTRPRHEEAGTQITIEGGKFGAARPAGAPAGTIITVRNLFFNLPARQKWARSATSEAGYILALIQSYSLAYPAIKFSLASEGRAIYQTSGNGNLLGVIAQMYDHDTANKMIALDPPAADAKIWVTGYVGQPNVHRANRGSLTFFVNGRWVQSRMLAYAVQEAYHSLLPAGRYPLGVIQIAVPPDQVDANVHPAKTEVRFLNERQVFAAVQQAVRAALIAGAEIPGLTLEEKDFTTEAQRHGEEVGEVSRFDPLSTATTVGEVSRLDPSTTPTASLWDRVALKPAPRSPDLEPLEAEFGGTAQQVSGLDVYRTAPIGSTAPDPSGGNVSGRDSQESDDPARLPPLRVVGQFSNSYVIAEGPNGLYLLDQHAAHERVLYEDFQARLEGRRIESQMLLEPAVIEPGAQHRLALQDEARLTELRDFGFDIEPFGDAAFVLRAVPSALFGKDVARSLTEMLDEADGLSEAGCGTHGGGFGGMIGAIGGRGGARANGNGRGGVAGWSWRDRLAASLACHSAVRANHGLTFDEMRTLIDRLEDCASPRTCAHGRPTVLYLSQGQLEKSFGRA